MSSVKISGNASGTGTFTISSPNSNTDRTITLPDNTGTILTTGSQIEFGAGTVSAPSISTSGDTNTGIFFPAADTIAFAEGGAEAMRIDSSGNVGIGTTSPSTYGKFVTYSSGGYAGINTDGQIFSYQLLDVATAGGRLTGGSSQGELGQIAIEQTTTGAKGGYIRFRTASSGSNVSDERMRIDSSGNVGIGTTSPGTKLHAVGGNVWSSNFYEIGRFQKSSGTGVSLGYDNTAYVATIGAYSHDGTASNLSFWTYPGTGSLLERARITSGGAFCVRCTAPFNFDNSTTGFYVNTNSSTLISVNQDAPLYVNRIGNDGILIDLYQAGVQEGNISVSGTTVSYNGGHLSRWAQTEGPKDDTLLKGTVLSNLDEMNIYVVPTTYWTEEDELPEGVNVGDVKVETHTVDNEQLNKVKVSDVEGDVNVAGVFVNWDYDNAHNVDEINMAMTGDMIIRIAQGVVVQKGDLLMSAGDGTAKPQGDDIVRSKTVAKVTSNHVTCTYADGSYCVPCVLMAC